MTASLLHTAFCSLDYCTNSVCVIFSDPDPPIVARRCPCNLCAKFFSQGCPFVPEIKCEWDQDTCEVQLYDSNNNAISFNDCFTLPQPVIPLPIFPRPVLPSEFPSRPMPTFPQPGYPMPFSPIEPFSPYGYQ